MYAAKNKMAVDTASLKIFEPGQNLPPTAPTPNIQVWVKRSNLPYLFGRVIGLDTYSVSAIATAQGSNPVGTYTGGLVPVVFQCTAPCADTNGLTKGAFVSFGAKFTAGANGNWGWLDVGQGPGGAALGAAIADGYQGTLRVHDLVSTKPGATWGPVRSGFDARMARHNATFGGTDPNTVCQGASTKPPQGDPLVTLPVGDISACSGRCGGVEVLGFVNVYWTGISKSGPDISITGCFVETTTLGGGGNPNAPKLGAIAPPTLIQ